MKVVKIQSKGDEISDCESENNLAESDNKRCFADQPQRRIIYLQPHQKQKKHYAQVGKNSESFFVGEIEKSEVSDKRAGGEISQNDGLF